ncbi:hypothetical protein IQ231_16985 [Cuspidothrix issatschenkoi LEGE 03284]|uniref:hypothetical protein n=1 Tax=Cuspidothrix issatschenkoi TaxID=230752 RepID=UPI00187FED67|nr:hypothetical protein [Cuspidothrix issatschenkoi]MBE9233319.1 hypothetical protein [Cuspidothrix issatschenkoi LEGE 03284]
MRTYKIKRRENGRFYLFSLFGTGRNFQIQEWDLAHDTNESKVMLQEMFKSIRPEELPEEDREPLLNSIDDLIPIGTSKPAPTGQIVLPGQHEKFIPITVNLSSF